MRYSFEKVNGEQRWQVRLNGEYVMHTDVKDSAVIDGILREKGYDSREEYFRECVERNMAVLNGGGD